LNGKTPRPWDVTGHVTMSDWHDNQILLPTTAAFSLLFSFLSVIKALVDFNIMRVHIEVKCTYGKIFVITNVC